ncbi:MAG: hypothetical protein K2K82_02360 [Muribaculaceae bacterium]|nr:hypothetical protein [Muribaculaceae bacterium]
MKLHIKYLAAGVIAMTSLAAAAQSRSAYFLDNFLYNYQHNPAMGRDSLAKGEVAMPMLGNLNVGISSNLGLRDLYFRTADGRLTTFMNPSVSASKFMKGINKHNRVGFEMREQIIGFGFKGIGGYNHVSVNAVADLQARVPGSLFSFLKEGVTNKTYEIGRVDANLQSFVEVALNHSHSLDKYVPGLRVGGTFKLLLGLGNADINMDRADLILGQDAWRAVTNGTVRINVGGVHFKTDDDEVLDGADMDGFKLGGFGMALDFGATYRLNQDWDFALAFNDIGFIKWNYNAEYGTNGERTFSTADYKIDPDNFEDSFDAMSDAFDALYQLKAHKGLTSRTRAIAGTMKASARYTLPQYRRLSFGLLNTTHMQKRYAWTEFRLSANVTPVDWLGVSCSYGLGTFGSSFGWMLNIAPKGFNFFVGMDHTFGKLAKQGIPLNLDGQFSMGINFPF